MPSVELSIEDDEWRNFPELESLAARILSVTAKHAGRQLHREANVSVLLCSDEAIRALNRDWRKIDKATNVLSFPAPGLLSQRVELGDIAIAYETTAAEAAMEAKSVQDHFAHLLTHGFLHLLGYDHSIAREAEEMEAAERAVLASLGIADPYADTDPLEVQSGS